MCTDFWRVAHAFDTSLPGWLVALPRRHVESMAQLDEREAGELGPLLSDLSRGLTAVTGCVKTYVMLFAEMPGFAHLHVHVVPRMPNAPAEELGPRVFARLGVEEGLRVPAEERDRLAVAVRQAAGR